MKIQIYRNLWFLQIAFLLLAPLGLQAQKKEISAAKDLVKAGKDLAKAESSMRKLLTDSANRNNKKIWNILFYSKVVKLKKELLIIMVEQKE